MSPRKIVILGSGFAGVYAYLQLHKLLHGRKDVAITLVNETDSFLFVPLIHEVATGSLSPSVVLQPLRTLPSCCLHRFVHGHVASVDLDRRKISATLHRSSPATSATPRAQKESAILSYDYLICAIGSETDFFGVPGAREHALSLKNLSDAAKIKNRIIEAFEYAEKAEPKEERARALRFVIVGAGPTGLELAGELSDYLRHEFRKAFPKLYGKAEILVIHGGARLLPHLDPWFDKKARVILARKKIVTITYNTQVTEVTKNGVCMHEESLAAGTVIWAAGVKARHLPLTGREPVERDERSDRIMVNSFLQIPKYPNVFIAGDQAWIRDKENGQPYPMRAQFAVREGRVAARNIVRLIDNKPPIGSEDPSGHSSPRDSVSMRSERLEEFAWKDQGFIMSLGKGGALAQMYGFRFSGPFAWWIYRTVYASKIIGWRARLSTILGWTLDLFLSRDISRL